MIKVANNYEPTIYNHIFLMAVIRNSANSGSNDRFGIKGLVSPGEGAKLGRLYDGKSGLVVLAEDESGPIPS